jgi:8-amino-7-oxononanoate synthase
VPRLSDLTGLLAELRQKNLYRDPAASHWQTDAIDFTSNDTLGLAAAQGFDVSRETPPGSGASRLVFGSHPEHLELEHFLAKWQGREAALLFSSGYAANVGALSALLGPGDVVLSDALNHASLIDGIRLSRAAVQVFPHLNLTEAQRLGDLQRPAQGGATWLVLESYYSMDGDSPDLTHAQALCHRNGWHLYLDEAHAVGLFGPEGKGLAAEKHVHADVTMLGFGKAVGSAGAAIVASEAVRDWLWNRARSFVFSTAPSPLTARILLEQLARTKAADEARARVVTQAKRFRAALSAQGWPVIEGSHGPIVSLVLGSSHAAQALTRDLLDRGIRAQAIRPPTVPPGTSRVRIILSARRSVSDLTRLEAALEELAPRFLDASRPLPSETRNPRNLEDESSARRQAPRRTLVLGTGTGIGKTYVSECLLRSWASQGRKALALKPIESGLAEAPPGEADWQKLGQVSLGPVAPLFGLEAALSPHLAARLEGVSIRVEALLPWVRALEHEYSPDDTLIESAGAVFSPVTDESVNADALDWLDPDSVVLVAADQLGVLSEVEATLRALLHKRAAKPAQTQPGTSRSTPYVVPVDTIVLNTPSQPDSSTGFNQQELERVVLPRFLSSRGKPILVVSLARDAQTAPSLL